APRHRRYGFDRRRLSGQKKGPSREWRSPDYHPRPGPSKRVVRSGDDGPAAGARAAAAGWRGRHAGRRGRPRPAVSGAHHRRAPRVLAVVVALVRATVALVLALVIVAAVGLAVIVGQGAGARLGADRVVVVLALAFLLAAGRDHD